MSFVKENIDLITHIGSSLQVNIAAAIFKNTVMLTYLKLCYTQGSKNIFERINK